MSTTTILNRSTATTTTTSTIINSPARFHNSIGFRAPFHLSSTPSEWLRTRLEDRALLSLSGQNSRSFLQGLITNNLNRFDPSTTATTTTNMSMATYTAFLTPPGRIRFDGLIYTHHESDADDEEQEGDRNRRRLLIDHHRLESESLLNWLQRFILRSRVKILKDPTELWAIWPNHPPDQPLSTDHHLVSILDRFKPAYRDPRGDQRLGYRILGNPSDHPELEPISKLPQASLAAYTLHVLLHACLPPSLSPPYPVSLPFEANLDYHHGVDFRKGCYVGQELTARTYHTGVIRKRLVPVSIARRTDRRSTTVSRIPTSIPSDRVTTKHDELSLKDLIDSAEFSLESHDHHQASSLTTATKKQKKSSKPIGRLCGPMIGYHGDDHDDHLFGLSLLRIDHEAFSPTSPTWPSIDLTIKQEQADHQQHSGVNWTIQPIKPHWWPSSSSSS